MTARPSPIGFCDVADYRWFDGSCQLIANIVTGPQLIVTGGGFGGFTGADVYIDRDLRWSASP